jgi:rSAM/selenodomain-associated transferase 1
LIEQGVFRQLGLDIRLLFQYHILRIPAENLAAEYNVTERDRLPTGTVQPQTVGIMAKAPIPGRVKTRLGESIGMKRSAVFFGELLDSLIQKFDELPVNIQLVIVAGSEQDRDWFNEHYPELLAVVQQGKHLGERLLNACHELKTLGAEDVLLISADTPALKVEYIRDAFQALSDVDIVLGPNLDGGYYLIGQSKCRDELYSDIPWSTSLVMQKTLERARENQLSVKYLPTLRDIDTIDDYVEFQNQNIDMEIK